MWRARTATCVAALILEREGAAGWDLPVEIDRVALENRRAHRHVGREVGEAGARVVLDARSDHPGRTQTGPVRP